MYIDVYEEPETYGYDDYRQDRLAEEAMRLYDAHEHAVSEAGGVCPDPDCYHNLDLSGRDDLPF